MKQDKILIGWCAGLFDGEGNVNYAQYSVKGSTTNHKWNVGMEIAMTELDTIHHFHSIIQEGTIKYKENKGMGKKPQWRWRCGHQQALRVAKLLIPYSVTKRKKLLQIINHYEFKKPIGILREKFNLPK
tara:strand:+ start:177 stop:563 length:387 start_codon:yes stop_codon:yes gene_type:complete